MSTTTIELRKQIRDTETQLRQKESEVVSSTDLEEIKKLKEECEAIIQKLNDLKYKLDQEEEDEKEKENVRSSSFDPLKCYGLASYTMNSFGRSESINADSEKVLKRSESIGKYFKADSKNLDLGKYIRGMVSGDWSEAVEERSQFVTSGMGAIIPQEISNRIIDYARNQSLFAGAGVPIYPMTSNKMTIGRVVDDPIFEFKKEGAEGKNVKFDLEAVNLEAKTAYGYAYISLETLLSASNVTDILYQTFSKAIANAIDQGFLYGGTGDNAAAYPAGILNDDKINVITATNERYDDFIKGVGAVKRKNGLPTVWAMNADTEEKLALFHDDNNVYREMPESLKPLNRVITNQLETKETGNDCLIFDPKALAIGLQKGVQVRMFQDSDYCIKNGCIGFQIYAMLDCAVTQPGHLSLIKNYTGVKS